MKTIIVKTQKELDKIKEVKADEHLIIKKSPAELKINCVVKVFGFVEIKTKVDCSWLTDRYFSVLGHAAVEASGHAAVEASGHATVKASGQAAVRAWDQATVEAWGQATVEAWDQATVRASGQATVRVFGQATVEAWDQATVEAWDQAAVRIQSAIKSLSLFGLSVLFKPFNLKFKFKKTKSVLIQNIKSISWFEENGIHKTKNLILYKKVSKDFLTQEKTENETKWAIGSTVAHPKWEPDKEECGPGKFHACSKPFFCDQFRNEAGDRYIAIKVKLVDVFEWKDNPKYPHKIGFREGKVLYECDNNGEKIEAFKEANQ